MTVIDYIEAIEPNKKEAFIALRESIVNSLPKGFEEVIIYNMVGYVVPHQLYPSGYHCDPKSPLPFIQIAAQKNFIALYHMGLYADEHLLKWFVDSYHQFSSAKLDMGKSCIRFKKVESIPYQLIKNLCQKLTVNDWIASYEAQLKNK